MSKKQDKEKIKQSEKLALNFRKNENGNLKTRLAANAFFDFF